jgi:hypothetical protein
MTIVVYFNTDITAAHERERERERGGNGKLQNASLSQYHYLTSLSDKILFQ